MIFQYIGNWINELFDFLKSSSNTDVAQALATLVGITITIQIIVKAFQVASGKSQTPTQELVWDISLKVLIIGIALNMSGFLDAIKISMEELHNLMSGNKNLYSVLDSKLEATVKLADIVDDESPYGTGWFYSGLIYLSFLLGIIPSFLIVITTDITLRLLLLIAPIVIFFRAYSWGKQMFDQWLSIFFTNLLTVFIVGTILNLFVNKYGSFINTQTQAIQELDVLTVVGQTLIMSLLLFSIMKLAVMLAEKIGSVSIESAPKSMANLNESARHTAQSYRNLGSSATSSVKGASNVYQDTKGYVASKTQSGMPRPPKFIK
jgi:type IV secretion system protein VirB6